jgi:hypothetical protein
MAEKDTPVEPSGPPGESADALERVRDRASALTTRIGRLAGEIADSEERVARTYEDSARLRPHAADRLRGAAQEARDFAARERDQSRRLLDSGESDDSEDRGGAPADGP